MSGRMSVGIGGDDDDDDDVDETKEKTIPLLAIFSLSR